MLAQVSLRERTQLLVRVENLDRERVVIEQPAGDRRTVAGRYAVEAIRRKHLGCRIEQRLLEFDAAAQLADTRQIGPDSRTDAVDPMARRARTLPVEYRLAASRVGRRFLALDRGPFGMAGHACPREAKAQAFASASFSLRAAAMTFSAISRGISS